MDRQSLRLEMLRTVGQVLHLSDLKHGRISKDLQNKVFALGDPTPSVADLPREIQLVLRVRF